MHKLMYKIYLSIMLIFMFWFSRTLGEGSRPKRTIPFAGMALWAAQHTAHSAIRPYAFPRYIRDG